MNNFRNLALWIIIALLLVALFNIFQGPTQRQGRASISYSEFNTQVLADQVKAGKLPPVEKRLPENPRVLKPLEAVGKFGGTWRRAYRGPSDRVGPSKLVEEMLVDWEAPTPDKILARLDQLIGAASTRTFALTARSTVPADKLTKLEIPIGVLDCKGCRYAAYSAVAKLDGVERATVTATPSAVIAWVDAAKVKREALLDALKKIRVELLEKP